MTAVVVAALTVGYFVIINRHDDPLACTGSAVLPVVAAPGAAAAVNDVAAAFNSTGPIARSTCVSVSVSAMSGASTVAALAAGWKGRSTPAPGLWVVDSAADVAALDSDNAAMTAGNTNTDLATSPVVLAVRGAPGAAVGSWRNVADGASGLKVAMPDPGTNRASRYALESILASSTPGGAGAPIAAGAVAAAAPTLLRLARSVPTAPTTTAAALTELSAGTSSYSAVPVVESELVDFNAANPPGLTAVYPTGGTAGDAILSIPLTAPWINSAMSDAAAKFDAFLRDPKGLAILAKAGLRTGGRPGTAAGVSLSTTVI
ncbi:MAG: substrate-binding domain-containing protein, partial [Actinomycetota bacterium]|nr:substrate-binding domain-containing protein [Actinomycetota bacterium]